jgi:tRNA pseudouridine55 synthase
MSASGIPAGLLLVDKPVGATSHDLVQWVRRQVGTKRVGHAGTLDPLASGLLPILVGPATRLVDALHRWPKSYVGTILLGRETETGDLEGLSEATFPTVPVPPPCVLHAAAQRLTGRQLQAPPVYSAKKIGGVAAHRIARRGFTPVLPPVPVTIHRIRLEVAGTGKLRFAARVSSGTYLRSLARDLGRLVGTGACLAALRRTGIGPLRVRQGIRPTDGLSRESILGSLIPPDAIPLPLPSVRIESAAVRCFRAGRPVPGPGAAVSGTVRVVGPDGLEGLGVIGEEGRLAPRTVLRAGLPGPLEDPGPWFLADPPDQG